MDFEKFQSIGRLKRIIVVTEKIDGTNAQVAFDDSMNMFVGSRNRWVTVENDNYGFARWCKEREEELRKLGPGRHYGEFWGSGIQRTYGLKEKRFSLFNVHRWRDNPDLPSCCYIVPVLYEGIMDTGVIDNTLDSLRTSGSIASPGFMNPEGIVVYHTATRTLSKVTLDNNDGHKWETKGA